LQLTQQQSLQKQLDAGLADRLAITQSKLNYLLTEQQLLRLQFSCIKAAIHIEDLMQRPLFDDSKFDDSKFDGTNPYSQSAELNP
jgi:outer membrane protein TolC